MQDTDHDSDDDPLKPLAARLARLSEWQKEMTPRGVSFTNEELLLIIGSLRTAVEFMNKYQWRGIETAVKDETSVLTPILGSWPEGDGTATYDVIWWNVSSQSWVSGSYEHDPPSHWMPLPEPPKDKPK